MLSIFLNVELPNHWYVAVIGLVFLCLQLYLCAVVYRRMKRQERQLRRLIADMEAGGDGRDIESVAGRLRWLRWVDANFPRDSSTPGAYTRDDVLKELDTLIASDGHYLLLQRTGVMAPLLGVIMTVLAFFIFEAPKSEEQSLGDILYSVMPLVAGVGVGAGLAFINQWLLHLVSGKVEAVRNAARAWFDAAIWSGVGLDTQAATIKAIGAIEKMAKAVTHAADQQESGAARFQQSIASIQQASAGFQQSYAAFGTDLRSLPQTLQTLTAATQAALQTLQSLIPAGQRTVAGLEVSVAAFRSAVENQFVDSAKNHQASIDSFAESVGRINESTARLHVSSGDLQETVNAHTNAFKALNRSLQKQVLPAHEGFLAAMTQFNGRAEGLLERLESLHGEIVGALEKLASLAPDASSAIAAFTASSSDLAEAIQHRFTPATDQHRHQVEALTASLRQVQDSAKGLADGGKAIETLIKVQARLSQGLGAAQESLRQSVDQLSETAGALRQSFDGELAPSQHSLHEAVGSFRDSARSLAGFIDRGLDPVTERLSHLDETLARFAGTVEVIHDFTEVRRDIERLSASLAQAAQVAEAIAALPEQVKQVLVQVAETQQRQLAADSKGHGRAWFWRR
jgi:chromosome segregation ATPase